MDRRLLIVTGRHSAGHRDNKWRLHEGVASRGTEYTIKLDNYDFQAPPQVTVSLSRFNMYHGRNGRLGVQPIKATEGSFDILYETWSDSIVYSGESVWHVFGFTTKHHARALGGTSAGEDGPIYISHEYKPGECPEIIQPGDLEGWGP